MSVKNLRKRMQDSKTLIQPVMTGIQTFNNSKKGPMMKQGEFGTESLTRVIDSLGRIAEVLILNLKDGIQLSDTLIIPSLIQEAFVVSQEVPELKHELSELSNEEIGFAVGYLTNTVLKVIMKVK